MKWEIHNDILYVCVFAMQTVESNMWIIDINLVIFILFTSAQPSNYCIFDPFIFSFQCTPSGELCEWMDEWANERTNERTSEWVRFGVH